MTDLFDQGFALIRLARVLWAAAGLAVVAVTAAVQPPAPPPSPPVAVYASVPVASAPRIASAPHCRDVTHASTPNTAAQLCTR